MSIRICCVIACMLLASMVAFAQPANDNCANASVIAIANNGYDIGTYTSASVDMTSATIESGEFFHSTNSGSGQNKKSVWFKFAIPVKRSVKVELSQPGIAIKAGDVGFAVYKANSCLPNLPYEKLSANALFGNSKHPCVDSGVYLVQVPAKTTANGPISITLDIGNPALDNNGNLSPYDLPANAYTFPAWGSPVSQHIDYDVDCHSIDDATEVCNKLVNYQQYNKSTWHTFTTPAYIDNVSVLFAGTASGGFVDGEAVVGYQLYEGNCRSTAVSALTLIDGCDSFKTRGIIPDYKLYGCGVLKPNTTYSIQLFFKYDFADAVRLAVNYNGYGATKAPKAVASAMDAGNQLGVLPQSAGGSVTNATDYFGCNSRHFLNKCGKVLPDTIWYNNQFYNLSTFYTFSTAASASFTINASLSNCGPAPLIRVFDKPLTDDCGLLDTTANLITQGIGSVSLGCRDAASYTVQILGTDRFSYNDYNYRYNNITNGSTICYYSDLGQRISLRINVSNSTGSNAFSLKTQSAIDSINSNASGYLPLPNGVAVPAAKDTFGCRNTVLPKDANTCVSNTTKAIYREFVIGDANGDAVPDSGLLYINNAANFRYIIYKGSAADSAAKQNAFTDKDTIKGLQAYTECRTYSNNSSDKICMAPGHYTLVTFGTDNDGNKEDQPTLTFYVLPHKYSLKKPGAYDGINAVGGIMQALQNGVLYDSKEDTLNCQNSPLPDTVSCTDKASFTKTIFREFVIGDADGDAKADSGVVSISNYSTFHWNWPWYNPLQYTLYKGDADELATAQGAHFYPAKIKGLDIYSECRSYNPYICNPDKMCVTPGTFTLVTFGDDTHIEGTDKPQIKFDLVTTIHHTPLLAQDMGNVLDTLNGAGTLQSDIDHFSCKDNADTINGFAPPMINGHPATKAIYRQFYLNSPASLEYCHAGSGCDYYNGPLVLFKGKATDGIDALSKYDWPSCTIDICKPLPAGWYTVVSYGSGPSYEKPFQHLNEDNAYSSSISRISRISLRVITGCEGPAYNRPHKASVDTNTKAPYLFEWAPRVNSTAAYPVYDTTYTLMTEHFNCTLDTPFAAHPLLPCDANANRVAYYVFQIKKESYLQIFTQGLWGQVFDIDVRSNDSLLMPTRTPIQPCMQSNGYIQLCRLQPGTYTLVLFASNANINNGCGSVTPRVFIDDVGYSRFDHANKAYDFDAVPGDSAWHSGKVGEVNPLNAGRAASNDFFYCTTGAQTTDPADASCYVQVNPNVYNTPATNNVLYNGTNAVADIRRNLWYSFVVDKPGWVNVKVINTPGKAYQPHFSIYQSDVDGSLPFATIVSNGQVDSTTAQGLTFIKNNIIPNSWYCEAYEEIKFYLDPCPFNKPIRYYIVVNDNWGFLNNNQVEVSVKIEPVKAVATKFDHYYTTGNIGDKLGAGTYTGEKDNVTCATFDVKDPIRNNPNINCAQKTLWYKFSSAVIGNVRFRLNVNGVAKNYAYNDLFLYREKQAGDSTTTGLEYLGTATNNSYNGNNWGRHCIKPGNYYLLISGCDLIADDVEPVIVIENEGEDTCKGVSPFDYYSTAGNIGNNLTPGVKYAGPVGGNLHCATDDVNPLTVSGERTLWYKFTVNVTGTVRYRSEIRGKTYTLDTYSANEMALFRQTTPGDSTSSGMELIRATGSVYDGGYWGTACISPGTYYILATGNNYGPEGCSYFNRSFRPYVWIEEQAGDFCSNPVVAALAGPGSATKSVLVDCHTIGTDFGEFGTTLTCPPNITTSTYKSSWFRIDITGNDTLDVTVFVTENTNANSSEINYRMNTGDCGAMQEGTCVQDALTQNTYNCLAPGKSYFLQVFTPVNKNGNPVTGNIDLNLSAKKHIGLCSPEACLIVANFNTTQDCAQKQGVKFENFSTYGSSIKYLWDFGSGGNTSTEVSPTFVYPASTTDITYQVKLVVENTSCDGKDSVTMDVLVPAHPVVNLGNDTSICQTGGSKLLDASSFPGATYRWQDGSTNATFNADISGAEATEYHVAVTYNNCVSRDTIKVFINPIAQNVTKRFVLCAGKDTVLNAERGKGETYTWNTGAITKEIAVSNAGIYWVDLNINGCIVRDSFVVDLVANARPLGKDTSICFASVSSYIVNATIQGAQSYTWQDGTTNPVYSITKPGIYWVDVKLGTCSFRDSLVIANAAPPNPVIAGVKEFCVGGSTVLDAGSGFQTYLWNSGQTSQTITVTAPGNYSVLVTRFGCSATSPIVSVSSNPLPKPAIVGNHFICNDIPAVLDAGANYTSYQWSTGVTTKTASIINAGKVKLTVTDAKGCKGADSVIMIKYPAAVRRVLDTVICLGDSYTMPAGGIINQDGVYADTLRNFVGCDSVITNVTLKIFNPIRQSVAPAICVGTSYTLPSGRTINIAGLYNDTIRAVNGCDSLITTATLVVKQPTQSSATIHICAGKTYQLPSGQVVSVSGIYTSTITGSNGCDSVITTMLNVGAPLAVSLTATPAAICPGETVTLTATASGGNAAAYQYSWQPNVSTSNIATVSLSATTTYTVTLTDNCTVPAAMATATVTVNPKPVVSFTPNPAQGCMPLEVQFVHTAEAGVSYNWRFGDGGTAAIASPLHEYLNAGSYTVSLVAQTAFGCRDSLIATNAVTVFGLPTATFETKPSPNFAFNRTVEFYDRSTGAISWQWRFGDAEVSSQKNPVHRYPDAGNYSAVLTVRNQYGCVDSTEQIVALTGVGKEVHIPNAFTANKDGKNDFFRIYGANIASSKGRIYNRYGELVWEGDPYNGRWDGRHIKNGEECISGAYVYAITVYDRQGGESFHKGTVVLIR